MYRGMTENWVYVIREVLVFSFGDNLDKRRSFLLGCTVFPREESSNHMTRDTSQCGVLIDEHRGLVGGSLHYSKYRLFLNSLVSVQRLTPSLSNSSCPQAQSHFDSSLLYLLFIFFLPRYGMIGQLDAQGGRGYLRL